MSYKSIRRRLISKKQHSPASAYQAVRDGSVTRGRSIRQVLERGTMAERHVKEREGSGAVSLQS